jgi:ribosomal protein L12E/L44/L45/RPP1/RPP2
MWIYNAPSVPPGAGTKPPPTAATAERPQSQASTHPFRPFGLVEPQKLREAESLQHRGAEKLDDMGPYDPSCPVSVAMAKLRSLIGESPDVNSTDLPLHARPVPALPGAGLSSRHAQLHALAQADRTATAEENEEVEDEEEEEVPLDCLRFFKLLNRRARRYAYLPMRCALHTLSKSRSTCITET